MWEDLRPLTIECPCVEEKKTSSQSLYNKFHLKELASNSYNPYDGLIPLVHHDPCSITS